MSTGPLDQVISLTLQVNNQEAVKKLRDDQAALKTQLEALPAAYAKGGMSATEYERSLKSLGNDYERITNLVKRYDQAIADEAAALHKTERAVYELADGYEVLDAAQTQVVTTSRLVGTVNDRNVELWKRLNIQVEQSANVIQSTGTRTRNLTQHMTQGSYAIQDFAATSGDLGAKLNSVTNNVMMVTNSLGPMGVAVGVGLVGVTSLYRNLDSLKTLWQDRNPLLDISKDAERLEKALGKDKSALEALQDRATLSNAELAEAARLTKEVADQEERLAGIRSVEAAKKVPDARTAERIKEVKGIIDQIGGQRAFADMRQIIQDANVGIPKAQLEELTNASLSAIMAGSAGALDRLKDMVATGAGRGTRLSNVMLGLPPGGGGKPFVPPDQLQKQQDALEQAKYDAGEDLARRFKEATGEIMPEADRIPLGGLTKEQQDKHIAKRKLDFELTAQGKENQAVLNTQIDADAQVQEMIDLAASFGIDLANVQQPKQSAKDQNARAIAAAFNSIVQGTQGNVTGDAAAVAAARAVELQSKGMDEQGAANQAVMELVNGMLQMNARQLTNTEAQIAYGQRLASQVDQLGQAVARQSMKVRTLLARPNGP